MAEASPHTVPIAASIRSLDCRRAFNKLTEQEKLYCHHLSRASWYGGLIVLYQVSPESPGIFVLLQRVFGQNSVKELEALAKAASLSSDQFKEFMVYAAAFYVNMGNYKALGNSKIVPALPRDQLAAFLELTQAFRRDAGMKTLWKKLSAAMYSLSPAECYMGFPSKGVTTYMSANCDEMDSKLVQEFLKAKDICTYNTRLFKLGRDIYEVRLASALDTNDIRQKLPYLGKHTFSWQGRAATVNVTRGDYNWLMNKVAENLLLAKEQASNETQRRMLDCYTESFTSGSAAAHREGSRVWLHDTAPVVESYLGFLLPSRDPSGVRAEFEGFVAVMNKEMSAKFEQLSAQAGRFLKLLPWPSQYEMDTFLRPGFVCIDAVTYAGSSVCSGINVPYYQDVRQKEGFKNVSLGNVQSSDEKYVNVAFLPQADVKLYRGLKAQAFEVQVGLHELFGHGSGKLFTEDAAGQLNFERSKLVHLETGGPVTSWYGPGETWETKFPLISSPYEECRAECVGLYLCLESDILRIFGHEGQQADDIAYVYWLNILQQGLLALQFYSPETKSWHQAHMQGRFAILQVLLEVSRPNLAADQRLVSIAETRSDGGASPNLLLTLNRKLIRSVGKRAIGDFLRKLQVYKSTADYARGNELHCRYSAVDDRDGMYFATRWRQIVLAHAEERSMFVQCNTHLEKGSECSKTTVSLTEYEASASGIVESFKDRFFLDRELDDILLAMWIKDSAFWSTAL